MADFNFEVMLGEGDLVDNVVLRLNFPKYFADVTEYDNATLESEINWARTKISQCAGIIDVLEPYYKEYLVKLRNEHDGREQTD